jgi:hypothetical protein
MAGPLGGGVGESESAHHQSLETSMAAPWEVLPEDPGVPTMNHLGPSMAGPLGGDAGGFGSTHYQC